MFEVKLTVVPAQIFAPVLVLMLIVGVTFGFTVIVNALLTISLVARQFALEVSTQVI